MKLVINIDNYYMPGQDRGMAFCLLYIGLIIRRDGREHKGTVPLCCWKDTTQEELAPLCPSGRFSRLPTGFSVELHSQVCKISINAQNLRHLFQFISYLQHIDL